jgi:tight adherence protein C
VVDSLLQDISDFLRGFVADRGSIALSLLFVAVFLGALAVPRMVTSRSPVQRRLAPAEPPATAEDGPRLRTRASQSLWNKLLIGLEKQVSPTEEKKKTTLQERLIQAGFMTSNAVRYFFVARILCAVGFPLATIVLLPKLIPDWPIDLFFVLGFAAGIIGVYLPSAWLSRSVRKRQLAVQEGFPDALDMLMVCVEAGLGLDAAFTRVGAQMAIPHPILAEHFGLVSLELRAGKNREAALRNMSNRIGLPEVTSFVILLIQSDQLGTDIAQTLRVQAEDMRARRMLRAEERAHMLPVKLSVVLVIFLLPSMVMVVMLPAIIRIVRVVIPALSG